MGFLFLLDRETGAPLFPVEERPVHPTDIPGDEAWKTQPFPVKPRSLMPHDPVTADTAWGANDADLKECRALAGRYISKGIFTPPTRQGTIMVPGNGSGTNWGSVAYDSTRQLLVLNTSRLATLVQLVSRDDLARAREQGKAANEDYEYAQQRGAPFAMRRRTLETAEGMPCNAPPWGTLAAVDLASGDVRWEVPFGQVPDEHPLAKEYGDKPIGIPNGGGPLVTASGVVFIAATFDKRFRAFDVETGRVLWQTKLPRSGIATPMTYRAADGRQMVVIAAGGHGKVGQELGDFVVAYALPASQR
jgi:quinoprotein glucose dehydrogenase